MFALDEYDQVIVISMGRGFLGREVFRTKIFLINGLMIDTGLPYYRNELHQAVNKYGLKLIVNTHYHRSCIGNNFDLQRTFSVPIKAHKEAVQRIKYPAAEHMLAKLAWGQAEPSKVSKLKSTLHYGDYNFRIIETTGYDNGHICLHEPDQKWLFSGNLLAKTPTLGESAETYQMEKDLNRLIELDPKVIFCRYYGVVENCKAMLEEKLKNLHHTKHGKTQAVANHSKLMDSHSF
ncbi:MAG: MBL fold metallo-hydrolase [Ignavibacteriales bacterium]